MGSATCQKCGGKLAYIEEQASFVCQKCGEPKLDSEWNKDIQNNKALRAALEGKSDNPFLFNTGSGNMPVTIIKDGSKEKSILFLISLWLGIIIAIIGIGNYLLPQIPHLQDKVNVITSIINWAIILAFGAGIINVIMFYVRRNNKQQVVTQKNETPLTVDKQKSKKMLRIRVVETGEIIEVPKPKTGVASFGMISAVIVLSLVVLFLGFREDGFIRSWFGGSQVAEESDDNIDSIVESISQYMEGLKYYNEGDYEQAVYWFNLSAEHGNSAAQNMLGRCYDLGLGVTQDFEQAVYWYKLSAEQENSSAQHNLSLYYLNDERDDIQGVYWARLSAEQGNSSAQHVLAQCYSRGRGVEQNYVEAVRLFTLAATEGHRFAQNELGDRYFFGEGVQRDFEQAVYWYGESASQGNSQAKTNMGYCYFNGFGVEQNRERAIQLWMESMEEGDRSVQAILIALDLISDSTEDNPTTDESSDETLSHETNNGEITNDEEVVSREIFVTGVHWAVFNRSIRKLDSAMSHGWSVHIEPPNASNTDVLWSSSDESIAIIDERGYLRGLSAGTVFITVTTVDGSYFATGAFTFIP